MDRAKVKRTLDQAISLLHEGHFASATALFQVVLDESDDATAHHIAQRYLTWWCLSFDQIVELLRATPRPQSIDEIIDAVAHELPQAERPRYARAVSSAIGRSDEITQLWDSTWIYEEQLRRLLDSAVETLRTSHTPVTLRSFSNELFASPARAVGEEPMVFSAVERLLSKRQDVRVLRDGYIIHHNQLDLLAREVRHAIDQIGKPILLSDVVSRLQWTAAPEGQLLVSELGAWLHQHATLNLLELADGWWCTHEVAISGIDRLADTLSKLANTPVKPADLLRQALFNKPDPPILLPAFVQEYAPYLLRNGSAIRLTNGELIARSAVNALAERLVDRMAYAAKPMSTKKLLEEDDESSSVRPDQSQALKVYVASQFANDRRLFHVAEQVWLHQSALARLVDEGVQILRQRGPRSTDDLLRTAMRSSFGGNYVSSPLLMAYEETLLADDRVFQPISNPKWLAIPDGLRNNNLAYVVLHEERRPLERQEIVDLARGYPKARTFNFALDGDVRFCKVLGSRWILCDLPLINDQAVEYLRKFPVPLLANTIKERVCQQKGLDLKKVIFDPVHDGRFVEGGYGRWTLRPTQKTVTTAVLDRLLKSAERAPHGSTLIDLARRALGDEPEAYWQLAESLALDLRFVECNGYWYARQLAFYYLTTYDVARLKDFIHAFRYPVPSARLAEEVLARPVCLTDLEECLAGEPDVENLASAGWILKGLQPEAVGRARIINFPVRSGNYMPHIDPDQLQQAEGDERPGDPEAPSQVPQPHIPNRPTRLTITLAFEDIRDGSLAIGVAMRRLLGDDLTLPAIRLNDENGHSFSCWRDSEHNLLHGFGEWYQKKRLSFGDKIILLSTVTPGVFFVQLTGQRNEQVFLEGRQRQGLQHLIDEAKSVNRSYHDLLLEVFEYLDGPLHIDDLWSMVNYRRSARKSTLTVILSQTQYFKSLGAGMWQLDKQEYSRMIKELERKLHHLEAENRELQGQLSPLETRRQEGVGLKEQLELATRREQAINQALSKAETESEGLRADARALQEQMQIHTVERAQAEAALTEAVKRGQLEVAEMKLELAGRTQTLSEEQERHKAEVNAAQETMRSIKNAYSAAELEARDLSERLAQEQKRAADLEVEAAQLRHAVETGRGELLVAVTEAQTLREKLEQTEKRTTYLEADTGQLREALQVARDASRNSEAQSRALREQLEQAHKRAAELESDASRLVRDLEAARGDLQVAVEEAQALKEQLSYEKKQALDREAEISQLSRALEAAQGHLSATEVESRLLREQLEQAQKRIEDLERDASRLGQALELSGNESAASERQWREKLDAYDLQLADLAETKEPLLERVQVLMQQVASLEQFSQEQAQRIGAKDLDSGQLRDKLEVLEFENSAATAHLRDLAWKLNDQAERLDYCVSERNALAGRVAELEFERDNLLAARQAVTQELSEQKTRHVEIVSQIEKVRGVIVDLQAQVHRAAEQETSLRGEVARKELMIRELEANLAETRLHLTEQTNANVNLESECRRFENQARVIQEQTEIRTEELRKAIRVLNSWGGSVARWWASQRGWELPPEQIGE